MKRKLSVPEKHQLKIARQTLRMNNVGILVMGGPNKPEARETIMRLAGARECAHCWPEPGMFGPTGSECHYCSGTGLNS